MADETTLPPGHGELLDEIVFGDARGGRKARSTLRIEVDRPLGQGDMGLLAEPAPTGGRLARIRHSHHLLAQCLSRGSSQAEASAITGYDPAYISALKGDPAFEELLAHYSSVAEEIFVDAMERLKSLGISTLEELQHRLDDDPGAFANRELLEMAEMALIKPQRAAAGAPGGSGAALGAIEIRFVPGRVIDGSEAPSPRLGVIDQED